MVAICSPPILAAYVADYANRPLKTQEAYAEVHIGQMRRLQMSQILNI